MTGKKKTTSGKLHSMTKPEMQHYLKNYKRSSNGRKDDFVTRIVINLLLSGFVDQADM